MEYVNLGSSNLKVSRIAFGCEQLGGVDWGKYDRTSVVHAVRRALELGINFFDTADVYALGGSEQALAAALGDSRHQVIIATKFGVNWESNQAQGRAKTFFDLRPERVKEAIESSLRRLKLEVIPLCFLHWPDRRTPLEDTLGAIDRAREEGKILEVGMSNFTAGEIRRANSILRICAVQGQYNLIDRRVEDEILPCCKELGIGFLAYGPLAQGLLTGKYGTADRFESDDRRNRLPHFQEAARRENLALVERLREIARRSGKGTVAQVALRWLLERVEVASVITGAKSAAQIEENAAAIDFCISEADLQAITIGEARSDKTCTPS